MHLYDRQAEARHFGLRREVLLGRSLEKRSMSTGIIVFIVRRPVASPSPGFIY